jgi:hypothetical protein
VSLPLRRRSRSRGQALVEFALIAPLLFLLIIAIIEAGRLVFFYHLINEAAREGARYAIVHGENAFDGCPSGPMPAGKTNTCDPAGDRVRNRIRAVAPTLDNPSLTFGYTGDSNFPMYCPAVATDGTCPFPSADQNNHTGYDVTVRVEYAYSPIVLLDVFGTIPMRAEATLVINN